MNARWLKYILIGLFIIVGLVLLRAGLPLIAYLLGVVAAMVLFLERILLIASFAQRLKTQAAVKPADAVQLSRQEAYEVLGLTPGATKEEIEAAYQRLIVKNHPDQGGSTYLASKINAARDLLLK